MRRKSASINIPAKKKKKKITSTSFIILFFFFKSHKITTELNNFHYIKLNNFKITQIICFVLNHRTFIYEYKAVHLSSNHTQEANHTLISIFIVCDWWLYSKGVELKLQHSKICSCDHVTSPEL